MLDQDSSVVVIDSDPVTAERTASLVKFLGFDAYIATNEDSLEALIRERPKIMTTLVAANSDYKILASAVRITTQARLNCACFLMEREGVSMQLPASLRSGLQGIISASAGYKELLGALHEAEIFCASRRGSAGDSSGILRKNLVGCSQQIHGVRELIKQVAGTDASVLISGESGTGKEVVARNLHSLSQRRDQPFVPINCGAIPAELLESELFGHEKGAFTGATSTRQGRFEIAEGGTLFLDEIGDMPLDMQVKLLRVLQEKSFERVGSHKPIKSNVRIIAATHQNLDKLVAEGRFRMDLFYRLNVFPVEIPPLRERGGDVPVLIEGYLNRLQREERDVPKLSDCALECLSRYYWPGNVRELFNLLERLAILHPNKLVRWFDLPDKFRPNQELFAEQLDAADQNIDQLVAASGPGSVVLPVGGIDLKPHLADIESSLMSQALAQSDWVVARAAKLLNLQRTTLVEKIRKFELRRPEEMTDF
ncbi:MAG: sigma-54 specific flagellar transcriptional regulator A [Halioglobus sp.]|jgi:sigma-54 specific flagellar transcriptional regulator A